MAHETGPSSSSQNSPEPRGLLYILLSAFAFLTGWTLAKLRTPNEDGSESIPAQDTPTPENSQGQIRSSVVAEIPPTPSQENQANRRKDGTPAWEKVAAKTIAAGTIGLLVVNIFLWCSTRKAANAAESAAKVAYDTLVAAHRPWVGIDGAPVITIKISKTEMSSEIVYPIKNFGSSPALNVQLSVIPYDASGKLGLEHFKRTEDVACGFSDNGILNEIAPGVKSGVTVFPNETFFKPEETVGNIPPSDEMKKRISIVGCISYTDQFNKIRHTRFCFHSAQRIQDFAAPQSPKQSLIACNIGQSAE